jgi:NitT/TauT family transport system substrate-binding protein
MKKIFFTAILIIVIAAGVSFWMLRQKSGPLQEVNLKLKWIHQAQFAGNYVAVEKGFYAGEGLKVNLIPFSFENTALKSVAEGKDTFGITGASELVLAQARGVPIQAFAVIYKINPIVAYSLKSSGITKPQDFIGKTIGIQKAADGTNTDVEILYEAMMAKLGIDRNKIKEVIIGYDSKELLSGKTDVSTGYIINEPHKAMLILSDVSMINTILMADYGVNMYADVLFATEETIRSKPKLVQGFLRATLKGWQYAIEHEAEAVNMTLKYTSEKDKEHESYMLKTSIPLILSSDSRLGWMEPKQWEQIQNILFEQKILPKRIAITNAYTMEFLQKIYPQ